MSRLIDYFVVVGLDPALQPDTFDYGDTYASVFDVPLRCAQLMRYPLHDYADARLPLVESFCLPAGLRLQAQPPIPTFFGFVLTGNDGNRLYGTCLTAYEPVGGDVVEAATQIVRQTHPEYVQDLTGLYATVPKCLAFVSHYPFFDRFQKLLTQLYRMSLTPSAIPLERMLVNVCSEIPVPPPGRVQVQVSIGDVLLMFRRPAPNQLPLLDVPLERLFMSLDHENILSVFSALLTEQKVILHSNSLAMLTVAAESLMALLFPFTWQHVYIPLLPRRLREFLNAPTPFLMGVHSSDVAHGLPPGVVVVDLDNNNVVLPHKLPAMPAKARTKLAAALAKRCNLYKPHHEGLLNADSAFAMAPLPIEIGNSDPSPSSSIFFAEREVRESFLRFFVALFSRYRDFVRVKYRGDDDKVFDRNAFLMTHPDACRSFLAAVCESQAFLRFVHEASLSLTPPVKLFDESIIAKANRSRLTLRKRPTPFLLDKSNNVLKTLVVVAPDVHDLPPGVTYSYPVLQLRRDLFCEPRPTDVLVRTDEMQVNSITMSWKTTLAILASMSEMQGREQPAHVMGERGAVLRQPQFRDIAVHTDVGCPKCGHVLTEMDVRRGWAHDAHNYTTMCPNCHARFVPRFVAHFARGRRVRQVTFEFLSTVTLKKEVENLLQSGVMLDVRISTHHPTIFWNLVVHFDNLGVPVDFILPQIDWNLSEVEDTPASTPDVSAVPSAAASSSHPLTVPAHAALRRLSSSGGGASAGAVRPALPVAPVAPVPPAAAMAGSAVAAVGSVTVSPHAPLVATSRTSSGAGSAGVGGSQRVSLTLTEAGSVARPLSDDEQLDVAEVDIAVHEQRAHAASLPTSLGVPASPQS